MATKINTRMDSPAKINPQMSKTEKEKFFGNTPGHLSYSSFSHIGEMASLKFAVGLRPGDLDEEDIVAKMMPLAKIEPGFVPERKIRKIENKDDAKKLEPCNRPDCLADMDRVKELAQANATLKAQLHDMERQYEATVSKFEAVEKANQASEENNEKLADELNEIKANKQLLQIEAERADFQKAEIKGRMEEMEAEILALEKEASEKEQVRQRNIENSGLEVRFSSSKGARESEEAKLIRDLENWVPMTRAERTAELQQGNNSGTSIGWGK